MPVKIKAFLIHMGGSVILALCAIALVFLVWYPGVLPSATGVVGIFLILLGVDAVLGPLFTLIVYKPAKPSLVFDMSVIVVLQLAAFTYGMWTVASGRPAWIVYNVDRFDLVQAHEVDVRRTGETKEQYRGVPWTGPKLVAAKLPEDNKEAEEAMFEAAMIGIDIANRPELYVALKEVEDIIYSKAAKPLEDLEKYNSPEEVRGMTKQYSSANCWVPMAATMASKVVLLNCDKREILGIVHLNPWPQT